MTGCRNRSDGVQMGVRFFGVLFVSLVFLQMDGTRWFHWVNKTEESYGAWRSW